MLTDVGEIDCFINKSYRFTECSTGLCRSYTNGKSMGNLHMPLSSNGSHYFHGKSVEVDMKDAVILHFDSCTFKKWFEKFQNLSNISQPVLSKIPFPFYKDSILHIKQCAEVCKRANENKECNECLETAKHIWNNNISRAYDRSKKLEDLGMCNPFTRK